MENKEPALRSAFAGFPFMTWCTIAREAEHRIKREKMLLLPDGMITEEMRD
jgi:hypothetical protein